MHCNIGLGVDSDRHTHDSNCAFFQSVAYERRTGVQFQRVWRSLVSCLMLIPPTYALNHRKRKRSDDVRDSIVPITLERKRRCARRMNAIASTMNEHPPIELDGAGIPEQGDDAGGGFMRSCLLESERFSGRHFRALSVERIEELRSQHRARTSMGIVRDTAARTASAFHPVQPVLCLLAISCERGVPVRVCIESSESTLPCVSISTRSDQLSEREQLFLMCINVINIPDGAAELTRALTRALSDKPTVNISIACADAVVEGQMSFHQAHDAQDDDSDVIPKGSGGIRYIHGTVRRISRGNRRVDPSVPHHIVVVTRDARIVQIQHQSVIGHNFLS